MVPAITRCETILFADNTVAIGWLGREDRASYRRGMASGKSSSSNGGESEANMRAVGPYLLQRTLGKGQTGEK